MAKSGSQKLTLGVIGCGRIARSSYLPAARHLQEAEIKIVADEIPAVAQQTASQFGIPNFTHRYQDLFGNVDAVILLLPHHLHASVAIDFLNRGVSVLCEKPLARSVEECARMIEASERGHATLAVALVRRFFRPSQLVKMLVDQRWLGRVASVDIEYGFIPAGSVARPPTCGWLYNKEQAGGGILISDGIHVLDLLLWWLGGKGKVNAYRDDGFSGVEAEVALDLEVQRDDGMVPTTVQLSLLRKLRNSIVITAERGVVESSIHASSSVGIQLVGLSGETCDPHLMLSTAKPDKDGLQPFIAQLKYFAGEVAHNRTGFVSGSTYLEAMRLIDDCYASRILVARPWESRLASTLQGEFRLG